MNKIYILGHENPDVDSIISGYLLEKILIKKGYNAEFVIPDNKIENDILNICNKYGLDATKYSKNINLKEKNNIYILVDHNERKLEGKIICIIDHHPTNKYVDIKNYYNKKISSTACFITKGNEYLLNKDDIKLAIIATLVDTASFHSTKSQKEDEEWVKCLCKKYNINFEELYKDGLLLTSLDNLENVSLNNLKKHTIHNFNVESSCIRVDTINNNAFTKILYLLKK